MSSSSQLNDHARGDGQAELPVDVDRWGGREHSVDVTRRDPGEPRAQFVDPFGQEIRCQHLTNLAMLGIVHVAHGADIAECVDLLLPDRGKTGLSNVGTEPGIFQYEVDVFVPGGYPHLYAIPYPDLADGETAKLAQQLGRIERVGP
jgi:hypothetical protein